MSEEIKCVTNNKTLFESLLNLFDQTLKTVKQEREKHKKISHEFHVIDFNYYPDLLEEFTYYYNNDYKRNNSKSYHKFLNFEIDIHYAKGYKKGQGIDENIGPDDLPEKYEVSGINITFDNYKFTYNLQNKRNRPIYEKHIFYGNQLLDYEEDDVPYDGDNTTRVIKYYSDEKVYMLDDGLFKNEEKKIKFFKHLSQIVQLMLNVGNPELSPDMNGYEEDSADDNDFVEEVFDLKKYMKKENGTFDSYINRVKSRVRQDNYLISMIDNNYFIHNEEKQMNDKQKKKIKNFKSDFEMIFYDE